MAAPMAAETAAEPVVVVLCGSTRFWAELALAAQLETLAGRIVVRPEVDLKTASALWPAHRQPRIKAELDELHRAKVRLADHVVVVAPGGYIGESTTAEIAYAQELGKTIRIYDPRVGGVR
jgi:hypothetical protein